MAVNPFSRLRAKIDGGILFRLVFAMNALAIGIIVLFSVYLAVEKSETLNAAMLSKNRDFAKFATSHVYATYLDFAVYSRSPEMLRARLKTAGAPSGNASQSLFRDNPDIVRFMILGINGEIILDSKELEDPSPSLATTGKERLASPRLAGVLSGLRPLVPAVDHVTLDGRRMLEIVAANPLADGGSTYAVAYYVSLDEVGRSVASSSLVIALASVLIIVVVNRISLRLGSGIVKPIAALREYSVRIAEGHYDIAIEIDRQDEIGDLGRAFDAMAGRLKASFDRIGKQLDEIIVATDRLRKSEDHLTNVFDSLSSILVTVAPDGTITQWNKTAVRYTGIPRDDALYRPFSGIAPFSAAIEDGVRNAIATRTPFSLYRERLKLSEDDARRTFDVFVYPLGPDPGDDVVVRIDDMTELCTKEDMLVQAQKMETVGNLAGGLAHDFNNVLGGIVGTISILKYQLADFGNLKKETLAEYVAIMEHSGERAKDMVRRLLTLSRKQEADCVPVDLAHVIGALAKICENSFDKSVEIRKRVPSGPMMVNADPTRIEQSLLNLCVNASHAMTVMRPENEERGGILTIQCSMTTTDAAFCSQHPEAKPDASYWRVLVEDTGVGMSSSVIAKIFDPFFSTKPKGVGTGLGLSMVYNIVKQHGGFIDVYSEVGKGSAFSVYLPALEDASSPREDANEDDEAYVGSGTVLVVDDEETLRIVAKSILVGCGFDVILAEDGTAGLEAFARHSDRIRAALVDMTMPGKSGKETVAGMRAASGDVKIILSSGFARDEAVEEILRQGADCFIQKPYTLGNLSKALKEALGRDPRER